MRRKVILWVAAAVAGTALTTTLITVAHRYRPQWRTMQGAVVVRDSDLARQAPLEGVSVTGVREGNVSTTTTDARGYFRVVFPTFIWPGQTVNFSFRRAGYRPLDIEVPIRFRTASRQLVIAAMEPESPPVRTVASGPQVLVSNLRVRYTVNTTSAVNIASAAKVFQTVNRGNVPCQHQFPCSPDGYWKASRGSTELDAGAGNEFRNVRVSCIAGPCPFTRIDSSGFAQGGRTITVSALDWSDTATFLVEAEVFRTGITSNVRETYPLKFGRTFNFTLPPIAEGVSLEAEIDGQETVFPLDAELYLTWATCAERNDNNADNSVVYHCELKPRFRF